jgi:hypothetical protein
MAKTQFNIDKYFEQLQERITNILSRPKSNTFTYDILDTSKSRKNKLIVLREKQLQMKIGEIWQEVLGSYRDCINLYNKHPSGLDILCRKRKFIIELKNRTNTDNASSRRSNLDKLAAFKHKHPEYTCIYANINADTEEKTMTGFRKPILHNGVELIHYVGYEFLTFILGDDTQRVIDFVRHVIDSA